MIFKKEKTSKNLFFSVSSWTEESRRLKIWMRTTRIIWNEFRNYDFEKQKGRIIVYFSQSFLWNKSDRKLKIWSENLE